MKVLAIILITLSTTGVLRAGEEPTAQFVKSDLKNLFTIKVDRKLVGATIELVYSNGDIVAKEVLQKKKMIIDFCDVKTGEYSVIIKKGDYKKDFIVVLDELAGVQYNQ
ncbi:MAG TPA: hypothetical protein PKL31_03745 [Fulvivirga sp.]|nr:hypothetical protein [Fulvivirga sp.]